MDVTKKRDSSKPAEEQGVFHKFDVRRVDGSDQPGGKHHGCRYFVLDLDHDPHAAAAMAAYARDCKATHPALSDELSVEYPPNTVDASTVDRAWARFCGAFGDGPDAPYPGMIAAFETHYGQSFRDKEWRTEAACWAAAWSKATARAEAAMSAPQPDAGLIGVQWWLAELDRYGNAKLVDGQHSGRAGADKAMYLIKALHLDDGQRYAVARVELSEPKPSGEGVNNEAIKTLREIKRVLTKKTKPQAKGD